MAKMSDDDFISLVKRRRDSAVDHLTDNRASARKEAMQFYRGDNLSLYGNSGDGLSTIVSRDLMEAVESMLPGLIKPFIAGDEMVRFEPTGPEDEEPAKQATEYINYLFQNHNDAVRVVYDFAKDGMLFRLGVAKVVHETVSEKQIETYTGLGPLELEALEADKDYEIVGDIIDLSAEQTDEYGAFLDPSYEVKCSKTVERSTFRVHVIAEDEFLFESRLANLDEARFLGHRATKPVGDFIAMGLPKAKVMKLKADDDTQDDDDRFRGESEREDGKDDDLARLVTIDECFIRCDRDGTGALSWRKVFIGAAGGDDIILEEEVDDHPYVTWTPIPLPHKLVGMSIHDLVRDLQMQGTALVRETMNALYLANRPQREVVEDQVNFEDLLNPEIGGLVRVKAPGMVREIATGGEGVIQQSLAMVEHIASIREQRTGSTRYNQGMDANSLNKTATGISIIQNASTQRQELIARMLAEGVKGIFRKLLGLTIRHQDKAQVIRLRGKWVEMDTKDWKAGYDMSVAVGLGTGNRDQQVAQFMQMLELDERIIGLQGGADGPILTMANVYEKLKRLAEAMGLKGVESYYTDPSAEQEAPQQGEPQPDPMAEAQAAADIELEKARLKAHTDIEIAKIKAEADVLIASMRQGAAPDPAQMDMEAAMPPVEPQDLPEPMEVPDDGYVPSGEAFLEGEEFVLPDDLGGEVA